MYIHTDILGYCACTCSCGLQQRHGHGVLIRGVERGELPRACEPARARCDGHRHVPPARTEGTEQRRSEKRPYSCTNIRMKRRKEEYFDSYIYDLQNTAVCNL